MRSTWRPYLAAVPDVVVERLRDGAAVLAVGHENPDADTLGATLGVVRIVESLGGTADPLCTDPVPPLYDFLPSIERFRTDPDPIGRLRPARRLRLRHLDRVGAVRDAPSASCSTRLPAGRHRSPRVERRRRKGRLDRARTPRRRARWSRCSLLRLGIPLDIGDGALATALMAGIVMDTADLRASQLDAADAGRRRRRWSRPGAPLSEISRRLYRSKPDGATALVRPGP